MKCRFCNNRLNDIFVDLNNAPASNSFLLKKDLNLPEVYYPLNILVCNKCFLVQIDEHKKSFEIFNNNYAYFSSFSKEWLSHANEFVKKYTKKLSLNKSSYVTEIASNDGYLLQFFLKRKIPCIGIEPSTNTSKIAKKKGIKVIENFFSFELSKKLIKSDLIIANNVIAHVPNLNDFVKGIKNLLKKEGTASIEFPHFLNLIRENQFDTIYHEHFSYFSLHTINQVFNKFGLKIYDVEKLSTHGGSLRILATHANNNFKISKQINTILNQEYKYGLLNIDTYLGFQKKTDKVKLDLVSFLINAKKSNKMVIAYGAAAKGNTLLNYSGIKNDLINFVVDKSKFKQNKFLPGSHIPVYSEKKIKSTKPDYILILPWNLKREIVNQLSYVRKWKGKFVTAVPNLKIIK